MSVNSPANLQRQLEELNLVKCSLMPGETLQFTPGSAWEDTLCTFWDADAPEQVSGKDLEPARFQLRVDDAKLWFEVELPLSYRADDGSLPSIFVRGDEITRGEHVRWQTIVKDMLVEVKDSEYPLYELISTHLLPFLHEEVANAAHAEPEEPARQLEHVSGDRFHALLTSHHLISPTKRRNMQHWSAQLNVSGFAKVGYPGVIYCEGFQERVEQFVANIKAMQWLALRVRFVEPAPKDSTPMVENGQKRCWNELEKVGEVVEEMRRLGREKYVVEMGIGSAGTK